MWAVRALPATLRVNPSSQLANFSATRTRALFKNCPQTRSFAKDNIKDYPAKKNAKPKIKTAPIQPAGAAAQTGVYNGSLKFESLQDPPAAETPQPAVSPLKVLIVPLDRC